MLNPGPWCTGLYGGFAGTPAEFSAGNKSGDPALTSIVINVLKIGATTSWLFFWLWTEWNCPPQYLQHNLNKLKNNRFFGGCGPWAGRAGARGPWRVTLDYAVVLAYWVSNSDNHSPS